MWREKESEGMSTVNRTRDGLCNDGFYDHDFLRKFEVGIGFFCFKLDLIGDGRGKERKICIQFIIHTRSAPRLVR